MHWRCGGHPSLSLGAVARPALPPPSGGLAVASATKAPLSAPAFARAVQAPCRVSARAASRVLPGFARANRCGHPCPLQSRASVPGRVALWAPRRSRHAPPLQSQSCSQCNRSGGPAGSATSLATFLWRAVPAASLRADRPLAAPLRLPGSFLVLLRPPCCLGVVALASRWYLSVVTTQCGSCPLERNVHGTFYPRRSSWRRNNLG